MAQGKKAVSVAVVIVTWKSAHLVEEVLHALMRQTVAPARVVFVDNGSDDVPALRSVLTRFAGCELIELPDNRGFAAANNVAIHHCSDVAFIALLNPDAFPEPGWLAALVSAAERCPDTAAFGSRMLDHSDPTLLDGAGDYLSMAGKPGRRGHGRHAQGCFTREDAIFSPCAAAALYRRPALLAVGGFDERFFCYVEDVDLGFRLLLTGHGSRYVPESVVRHIGSALTGRRSEFSVYHGQRNLVFNYVKNMPGPLFWIFLIPHVGLNLLYLLAASMMGRGHPVWLAKRDAIRQLPAVWRDRIVIQSQRKVGTLRVLKLLRAGWW